MRFLCSGLPEFGTNTTAFMTLFSASLTNFNLSIYTSDKMLINKWYGYGAMILFLIISAIALLNFLIAIISNVYDKLNRISIGLHFHSLIRIRSLLQSDKRYSSLVSAAPPFNVVTFFFVPLILWLQSSKLNLALLHYEYIFVMIVGIILYIFFVLLCIPFAYLAINFSLLRKLLGVKSSQKSKIVIFLDLVIFIILGIIILLLKS